MANLNFQQPPRNIASSSINSRNGGGFPTISGHVTPTQGGFPSNAFGQSQQGQSTQLSPNRLLGATTSSAQTLSNSRSGSMVGQRMFSERRPLPNIGGNIVSFILLAIEKSSHPKLILFIIAVEHGIFYAAPELWRPSRRRQYGELSCIW